MSSIETLKQNADILEVASRYCELKRVGSHFKAKENPLREDNTSSLFFYPDTGKFYDFGSGTGGDVLDFIQQIEHCTIFEAIDKLNSSFIGIPSMLLHVKAETPKISVSHEALESEFNTFEMLSLENPLHKKELLQAFPQWLFKEADKEDLDFFYSITRYDTKNNTLVAKWCKNSPLELQIITYKRRRFNGGKWINRKDTHPNQTAFCRIFDENKKIYVIEGMRDALTAILLGLNFIAIPTTAYSNIEDFRGIVTDKDEVVYIVEDKQGFECMTKINEAIEGQMICLTASKEIKMDLSDFTMSKNSINEVLNGL